jgi:hypothetical protein
MVVEVQCHDPMIKISTATKQIPILAAIPIPDLPVGYLFARKIRKIQETGVLNN